MRAEGAVLTSVVVSLAAGGGMAVANFLAISALHIQDPEELLLAALK